MAESNSAQETRPFAIQAWSVPRCRATATLTAFSQREDVKVFDEPLMPHFHNILDADPTYNLPLNPQEFDPNEMMKECVESQSGKPIHYIKNHSCHWDEDVSDEWIEKAHNFFLIRDPTSVVASFAKITKVTTNLLRYDKLWSIYEKLVKMGRKPLVIHCDDLAREPETVLRRICQEFKIEFTEKMLSWKTGAVDNKYPQYYTKVQASTGFAPFQEKVINLPPEDLLTVQECQEPYDKLAVHIEDLEAMKKVISSS